MRALIENLVSEMLDEHIEKILDLSTEVEDLRRRLHLMIRLGRVSEIHESNQQIKVKHGDLETPFVKWFAQSAGRVSHYRCPTVKEQVILLNYAAGNTGTQSIALVGIDSTAFPFPTDDPNLVMTAYGDKCAEIWDMENGTLTLKAEKEILLDTELVHATENIRADAEVSDQVRTMSEDRNIYNSHDHPHGDPTTSTPNQAQ